MVELRGTLLGWNTLKFTFQCPCSNSFFKPRTNKILKIATLSLPSKFCSIGYERIPNACRIQRWKSRCEYPPAKTNTPMSSSLHWKTKNSIVWWIFLSANFFPKPLFKNCDFVLPSRVWSHLSKLLNNLQMIQTEPKTEIQKCLFQLILYLICSSIINYN